MEKIELRKENAKQKLEEIRVILEKTEQNVRDAEEQTEQAKKLKAKAELDKIKAIEDPVVKVC